MTETRCTCSDAQLHLVGCECDAELNLATTELDRRWDEARQREAAAEAEGLAEHYRREAAARDEEAAYWERRHLETLATLDNLTITGSTRAMVGRPTPDAQRVHSFRRGLNMIGRNGAPRFFAPVRGNLAGFVDNARGRIAIRDAAGVLVDLHLG